jgi:uncharacterized protein YndB with AHSA1/START domain
MLHTHHARKTLVSADRPGSAWQLVFSDGRIADTGEVIEIIPPRRLVLKWRRETDHLAPA